MIYVVNALPDVSQPLRNVTSSVLLLVPELLTEKTVPRNPLEQLLCSEQLHKKFLVTLAHHFFSCLFEQLQAFFLQQGTMTACFCFILQYAFFK